MNGRISRLLLLASSAGLGACATIERPVAPAAAAGPVEIQILGLNDFHGNLEAPRDPVPLKSPDGTTTRYRAGGAAQLSATLKRLRTGQTSVTVAAGDLIGATPLVSAYFLDEPTIKALGLAGLDYAAVGNHEFDKGAAELKRIQDGGCSKLTTRAPCAVEPHAGASFRYLAANVITEGGNTLFPGTAIRQMGPVKVGFIGMPLQETATLVTPAGVAGLTFADEAATANALVPRLKAEGADLIVLLIHQGGYVPPVYDALGCDGLSGDIVPILGKLDPAIRVVVSGHTHHAYACEVDAGGAPRLLTSAGKNGYLVTDIRLAFDPATRRLVSAKAQNLPVLAERDPEVQALVDRYVAAARPAAERVVGKLPGPALKDADDGDSPAGELIADAQLAANRSAERGGAQIAFINSGGVRTDLVPKADGSVTFGQIFATQPFGNSLVVKTLTGAQLKALIEQGFRDVNGKVQVSSLLIPSEGFTYRFDRRRPAGSRVLSMALNGRPIDPAASYRVSVNNFLASGGDGYTVLAEGKDARDGGLDLDALESWLRTNPRVPAGKRVTEVK
ncbi:bifunctional metallophosphatase/5'-nucleotidase [Sphingomonas glaciei]|uniref:Bifunctional metallophosphatase/5'-nucleotidase n=1 Tax=Sphingomonas glaciei TaxID=2938948 RepID=A0ABY5N0P8_9SPHN|nr:bifunctional metallophosphatase/5'-nucleotidase [Sphingomonas glaciei]UUR08883.1 bifunctional metallophosphatase/5'-nucleotidase [Sphingomonas glaciei]